MTALDTISTAEMRELLVPTHLHYDLGTKSLKVRAFAEILTKILYYASDNQGSLNFIIAELSRIAHVKRVSEKDTRAGLFFLEEKGIVTKDEDKDVWHLTPEGKRKIKTDIEAANRKAESILDSYFGTKIDRDILIKWFRHAAAQFFGSYNDIWTRTLYKRDLTNAPSILAIEETIKPSIKKYNLQTHADELLVGFRSFIGNYKDPLVNEQIWSFAQAMLSARLITASIGPDPITITEFKNAKLFLDTNTLFLASLEAHRSSDAFLDLVSSLKEINTTLHILPHTIEEYNRVIRHKKQELLKVINYFDRDVVEEVHDSFIKTALKRGCIEDPECLKRFFETIENPIEQFDKKKVPLVLEESEDVLIAAEEATYDEKRLREIAAEWNKRHGIPKSHNSVMHDAALDGAVEHLRKRGENVWVMTRDASMQYLSNRWTGNEHLPVWLPLDAFIRILAVSSTGPSHDPTNFTPLLSSLIELEMEPTDGTFQIEDLSELIDLEERVKELDKNDIKLFANKLAKLRMSGKSRTDSELQLEIRRTFNRKKIDHGQTLRALQEELVTKDEIVEKASGEQKQTYNAFVKKLTEEALQKKMFLLAAAALVFVVVGTGLIYLGWQLPLEAFPVLAPVLISLGISEIIIPTVKWLIPGFKQARHNAHKDAHKKAQMLIRRVGIQT